MGFRYRRSIGLGGGVRLNLSKRGLSSVSVGRPGATLNLGRRGVRSTVGLSGTGLSYSTGRGGGAVGILALIGLAGAALGLLFWLLGAAARGNRAAQLAVVAGVGLCLFAWLRAPEGGNVAPAPNPASSPPLASIEAPAPIAPAYTPTTALACANLAATMRTTTGANLRSGPSAQARAVEQLPAGALVEVVSSEGRWAKVRAGGNGATGWVAWSLLTGP